MLRRRRRDELARIYARIPEVECKGLCEDSCGPIAMSVEEDRRIRARGVTVPPIDEGLDALARGEEWYCPALVDGRCAVYEVRPAVCRLWGATESMPCPHGCGPERPLRREESHDLLRRATWAGGGLAPTSAGRQGDGGDGP